MLGLGHPPESFREPGAGTRRAVRSFMSPRVAAVRWYDDLMWPPHHHRHTYEDYVRFEGESQTRHEYINGDIVAMAGGSPDHAGVTANVIAALSLQLRGRPCRVFSPDLKIRIAIANVATYPDVSVVCGHPELDPEDANGHTILNPVLIVEVLSPSTAAYDLGEKFGFYKLIPSLREYVVIDHAEPRMAVWRRGPHEVWSADEITSGEARLVSIDCTLALAEIYRDPFRM